MKLTAQANILWGAKKIAAGETFEADEATFKQFQALGWVAAPEDPKEETPKKATKKK